MAEGEATPESVYMNRRDFIKGTSIATLAATASFYGCGIGPTPNRNAPIEWSAIEEKIYPVKRNTKYSLDRSVTEEKSQQASIIFSSSANLKTTQLFMLKPCLPDPGKWR